jgi:hypothetical protein
MKKIRQTNFYTITASDYPKMLPTDAALWIMPKKTFFNPAQRRCSDAVIDTFWDTPTLRSYSVGVPPL